MFFTILFAPLAQAEIPLPSAHPVKEIEDELKTKQQREQELKKEMQAIKSGLDEKKQDMLSVAKKIKKNEQKLINLEQRIDAKEQEQLAIEVRLNQDRGSISDLVLALERMRRIPPEALLARPGAPLETAQSAMLLQSVLPSIHHRAEGLKKDVEALEKIITDLKADRESVIETSKNLETDRKKLSAILSEREQLYSKTAHDVEEQQAELKKISSQAKNLRDLVARIEKRQKEEDERHKQVSLNSSSSKTIARATPTRIPRAGEAQLPVSGLIRVGYGKQDDIGAISQGLKIEGRENALVVAPMGGVVDYTGNFKGYGQIIILKHQKGYHSLVAGLGKIDTVVGRAVSAGEPIGRMGVIENGKAPLLYYELRYQGNPVNPSKKISGLK